MKINSLARHPGSSRKLVSLKDLSRQAGIGLVEIMVAMAIGVFMLGGILSLVLWVSQARLELDKTSEQIENGRYAMQLLSDELRLAGFWGASQVAVGNFTLPLVCPSSTADLEFLFDSLSSSANLPVAVQGVVDLTSTTLDISCFTNFKASSEAIVVRRAETESIAATAYVSGMPYIQMSACQNDAVPVKFELPFDLRNKNCAGPAVLWPYTMRAYYLSDCDICNPSDNIPTLKMVELRNSGAGFELATQSMVEGIEDIHFEYGMDLTADGAPDCYVSDPSINQSAVPVWAGCPATGWSDVDGENWSNVVSVRVNLLARSTETSPGWSDTRTYDLGRRDSAGNSDPEGPFNDNYKRQVYSTVVTLPNVSGVREE